MAIKLYFTRPNIYMFPAYQDFRVMVNGVPSGAIVGGAWYYSTNKKATLRIQARNYDDTGFIDVIKLKAPIDPNSGDAYFSIEKIFQDYLETDIRTEYNTLTTDVTSVHKAQGYTKNNTTLNIFNLIVGGEYELNGINYAIEEPNQQNVSGRIFDPVVVFNGVAQVEDGISYDVDQYEMRTATSKVLTTFGSEFGGNFPAQGQEHFVNYLRKTDYHTIAFFNKRVNDTNSNSTNFINNVYRVQLTTYEAGYTNATNYYVLNPSYGVDQMNRNDGLLFFGCGVQNFIDAGTTTLANWNDITNYRLSIQSNDLGNTVAHAIDFTIQEDDCKGFETIRLAWVNSLGTYDYYNFNKRSTKSSNSKRTTYEGKYGYDINDVFGSSTTNWGLLPTQGGTKVLSNQVTEDIECNTNFINEEMAVILKGLFVSPKVHMQLDDGTWVAVVVSEKDYVKQTSANDKVVQYALTIVKSHKFRTQRQG